MNFVSLEKNKFTYYLLSDSTDEAELDKQIKVLEDDLHVIRINSFKLPETEKDTRKSY